MRVYRLAMLVGFMAFAPGGCSGDQEEPAEPAGEGAGSEAAAPEEEEEKTEEEKPAEEPAPVAAEPAPAPEPAPAASAEPAGFEGAKVWRFVNSFALNVRSGPTKDSPVTRHVKWGDKIEVVVNGEWAKIGPNEYVAAARLSETEPTKNKAAAAKGPKKAGGKKPAKKK